VTVSGWTVRRRLKVANFTPKLISPHLATHLCFSRDHIDWSYQQWRSILFSDESRMCLHGCDRRGRVYRRPGERFTQCCIAKNVTFVGGSCMVWVGISMDAKTELVFIETGCIVGGLTANRYIQKILADHVVPILLGKTSS